MMLSRTEKEQRVIELYQQGKNIREIAHEVHMSFGNIGAIERKVNGLQDDDDGKSKNNKITTYPIPPYPKILKLSHYFQMVKSLLKWPLG
jgi:hypothetical protein